MLTVDDLKQSLPQNLKGAASQELCDKINQASLDPEAAAVIRENFVSYSQVLKEGRFKVEDYLNAVAYVSFKLMDCTNQEAYQKAFPQRYQTLVAAGRSSKEISAYVANYNKNKLVNLILEQSLIPSWVLNQDVYQEAIATQLKLMRTANSEKVRAEAANSILTHLKRPETKKVEIDLGVRQDSGLEALKVSMAQLAEQQLQLIQQGVNTREIAHQRLVPKAEIEDAVISDDDE
jgi:hypothetical protein